MVPLAHLSPQPKRHLDRFGRFMQVSLVSQTDRFIDRQTTLSVWFYPNFHSIWTIADAIFSSRSTKAILPVADPRRFVRFGQPSPPRRRLPSLYIKLLAIMLSWQILFCFLQDYNIVVQFPEHHQLPGGTCLSDIQWGTSIPRLPDEVSAPFPSPRPAHVYIGAGLLRNIFISISKLWWENDDKNRIR